MTKKFLAPFTLVALLFGSSLHGQNFDYSVTMGIGNASGSLANQTGLNNSEIFNSFAGGFQASNNKWILGVSFRQYVGVNWIVSTIPHTGSSGSSVSAAGSYENRMRKSDALGLDFDVAYKVNIGLPEGYYSYIGARIQRLQFRQVDIGSGEVWASTSSLTSSRVIADNLTSTKMNFNPMLGIGYSFNDRYFGQLNIINSTFAFERKSASGMITELSFGIKF